jgi:hypothetical protein
MMRWSTCSLGSTSFGRAPRRTGREALITAEEPLHECRAHSHETLGVRGAKNLPLEDGRQIRDEIRRSVDELVAVLGGRR